MDARLCWHSDVHKFQVSRKILDLSLTDVSSYWLSVEIKEKSAQKQEIFVFNTLFKTAYEMLVLWSKWQFYWSSGKSDTFPKTPENKQDIF